MALDWSLKELYDSFGSEAFKKDLKKFEKMVIKIKEWINENTATHEKEQEKLEEYVHLCQGMNSLYEKLATFASLTMSVDANNEYAKKYDAVLEQKISTLAEVDAKMDKWISEIAGLDTMLQSSMLLKEHEFYFQEIVKLQKYRLGDKEEGIIARMQNTGSSSWVNYKNLMIANHLVEIEVDGELKKLPLTEVLNMAYSKDKEVRKKAYEAEIASYSTIEEGVAAALNAIKGEVLTVCEMRKYTSPLEMTLEESRMDKETLDAMLAAIKDSLPDFHRYLRAKAVKLGYENGLPFYELYAPVVEKDMPFPYEEGKTFVEKNFRDFSDHLADFAKKAMDHAWIDVMPKQGKVGGAFCCGLHSIGECRVMLNYGNNLSDVITMAHELGHGFHDKCLNNESNLNISVPMPLAETASTFCETIVKKAALKEADEEGAIAILETEISDATQVIVDIYSRFLFESKVFEERKEGPISVNRLKEMMLEAQKEAYGEGLDEKYLHPYMWTWKPHYYYAGANFYNFPYAFGLLFAKGLYAQYEKDRQNFPKQYEKLLAVTGKKSIADVVKEVGMDVHDKAFWEASLQLIVQDIDQFITLSEKK